MPPTYIQGIKSSIAPLKTMAPAWNTDAFRRHAPGICEQHTIRGADKVSVNDPLGRSCCAARVHDVVVVRAIEVGIRRFIGGCGTNQRLL